MSITLDQITDPRLRERIAAALDRAQCKRAGPRAEDCAIPEQPVAPEAGRDGEDELQSAAEEMYERRGYRRMNARNYAAARAGEPVKGFYGHLRKPKGNDVVMPDSWLIAFPNNRRMLMIELKVNNRWQPGQKDAIAIGIWKLAWTVREAEDLLNEWEGGGINSDTLGQVVCDHATSNLCPMLGSGKRCEHDTEHSRMTDCASGDCCVAKSDGTRGTIKVQCVKKGTSVTTTAAAGLPEAPARLCGARPEPATRMSRLTDACGAVQQIIAAHTPEW